MTDYTWDNKNGTGVWNDQANWTDGVTPHANGYPDDNGDKAIFDNSSVANCDTGENLTVGEIDVQSNYTGTITQGGTMTVDDAGAQNGNLTVAGGKRFPRP